MTENLTFHYDGTDLDAIVAALAGEWPRIFAKAMDDISQLKIAPPHRMVVLVRTDGGLLFYLESGGRLAADIACVTIQFVADAFLACEDDFDALDTQLRDIARRSFMQSSLPSLLGHSALPIAIDNYQSADPSTLELLPSITSGQSGRSTISDRGFQ